MCCILHGSGETPGEEGNFVAILLQIYSGIC